MKRINELCLAVGLCLALCASAKAGNMDTTKASPTAPPPAAAAPTSGVSANGNMDTTVTDEGPSVLAVITASITQALSSLL